MYFYSFLLCLSLARTLLPTDVASIDEATLLQIEQAIEATEKQADTLEKHLPEILRQAREAQRVAINSLFASEIRKRNSGFFTPHCWTIPLKRMETSQQESKKAGPFQTNATSEPKTLTPTVIDKKASFILPAEPAQIPANSNKSGWYTFAPQRQDSLINFSTKKVKIPSKDDDQDDGEEPLPFRKPGQAEEQLRTQLLEAFEKNRLFTDKEAKSTLDAAALAALPEHSSIFIKIDETVRPLSLLENYLAHRRWYEVSTLADNADTPHCDDIVLEPSTPFAGSYYCVVDAPTVVRRLENSAFADEHFFRSDGKIIQKNRLDLAFGFYEGFGKQIALLGAETVATSLLYQRIKTTRTNFVTKVLMAHSRTVVREKKWQESLTKKLRFIPWNPFNKNIRNFVLLYAALEEAVYQAEKHWAGPYVSDKIREKASHPLASIVELKAESLSSEYATYIPISAYTVVELLTTGRFSCLEALSEVFVGQPKTKTGAENTTDFIASQSMHFLRRFLIAFLTLRYVDGQAIKDIIAAIVKNKKEFLAIAQDGTEAQMRAFVEKAGSKRRSLLSIGLGKINKTKEMSSHLSDVQVVYTKRLKARWVVNSLFFAGLATKKLYKLFAFFNDKKTN
ncbi:MAG: hypothetical protein QG632_561 [Candidatus Dependentiae bacterium]|nr:hypothetical protein [Candidatus Dependentiae bacterium]